MSLNSSKTEYCIIASGYTARLINYFAFDEIILEKSSDTNNNIFRVSHKNFNKNILQKIINKNADYNSPSKDEIMSFLEDSIFIDDSLWGKGLYKLGDDDEINKIKNILDTNSLKLDGIICFKSNGINCINYINILEKCNFCYGCNVGNIYDIVTCETDTIKLTIYHLDTESG